MIGETPTFSAPLTLDSSVALGTRYDSNLFLSETDPIGDFSTVVTPRVDLQVDQRLIEGQVRYQATGEWYRQRTDLNRLEQQDEIEATLKGLRRWVRHLDLELQGLYTRMSELPGTSLGGQSVSRGGVLFPATIESTEWRGLIIAGYAWSRRLESSLKYIYIGTYFDEVDDSISTPTATTYDSIVHDAQLVLSYRQSPGTTLTLTPAWGVTRVVPSGTAFVATTDSRTAARLTAGAEYSAASALWVKGEVGVIVIEDDRPRLGLDLDIKKDWSDTELRVKARQYSGMGLGVIDTVSITRSLTADATRSLGRYTEATVRLDIIEHVSAPTLATDPTVAVVTYGAGVAHDLTRWLTVRLAYTWLTQRSTGIAVDGQRHSSPLR